MPFIRATLCLLLAWPACAAAQFRNPPENFEVQRLADGVYAVVRKEPPGLMMDANNLFVVNDEDVVVVDANGSATHTREVVAALKKITTKPVRYVINTHWHDDHVMGDRVWRDAYPGVEFVGHARMREYLPTTGAANHEQMTAQAPKFAEMLRATVAKGKDLAGRDLDAETRAEYESDVSLIDQYVADAPGTSVVLPSITVERSMTLYRGDRAIEILHAGSGHTAGDLVVWLPKERILATGDLVVWPVPLVGGDQSHVTEWAATLAALRALDPAVIVPGHGRVLYDAAYLELMEKFFAAVTREAAAAITRGESLEQAQKSVKVEEYRRPFAGESRSRGFLFDVYAVSPSVAAVYREKLGRR
jgi:glyoxylase-like metal-dependent hydrolase (beta-lactamase superfamily II)